MTESITISFTSGFLLGQITLSALLFIFIKFFIFGDPAPSTTSNSNPYHRRARSFSSPYNPIALSTSFAHPAAHSSSRHHARAKSGVLRPTALLTPAEILGKTYYNVLNHQPESVDWFNVLFAQAIAQVRLDASADDAIVTSLTAALNGERKPSWLDEIRVTEVGLGDEFPIFSNVRVIPVAADGKDGREAEDRRGDGTRLQARMDVDLSDAVTLGIETKLVLNYPRPRVAVMPVALAVSVVRFSGTLSISFVPSPSSTSPSTPTTTAATSAPDPRSMPTPDINGTQDASDTTRAQTPGPAHPNADTTHPPDPLDEDKRTTPPTTLTFSFSPSYRLELSTHSLLGSRARLQDVPKIAQLVEARLHAWFDERCVAPRFQQVVLPSLWPRRRNTRGGTSGEAETSDQDGKGKAREGRDGKGDDGHAGSLGRDASMSEVGVNGTAREEMRLPRMRKQPAAEKGERGHTNNAVQMPGSLPDG
ncbi:MAG: hypothetical protein Q9159_003751 [Coniocarpon cinnabarinum]